MEMFSNMAEKMFAPMRNISMTQNEKNKKQVGSNTSFAIDFQTNSFTTYCAGYNIAIKINNLGFFRI